MDRIRIAVVFEYGSISGGERSMLAVFDQLDRRRFEPIAVAPSSGRLASACARRQLTCVPFDLSIGSRGGEALRRQACDRLLRALASSQADVVHANSLSMGRLTGAIADRLDIPCIAHLRDIIKLSRAAMEDLNRNRVLLAVSKATRDFHVAAGLDRQRTRVVYNGVDCRLFRPQKAAGTLRRELGLSADSFLVASIGQIALRKGLEVLARGAVIAADRLTNAHYLIVGERTSQKRESVDYERSIVAKFRDGRIPDRLHCLGYRQDVPRLLNEIDLLVHAAHQEPLGRVLLEAAASGVPILTTPVGGTPEILEDGHSARFVESGDADALCAGLIAMHKDAGLRRRLAKSARQQVTERFSIDKATAELCGVWESAVAS